MFYQKIRQAPFSATGTMPGRLEGMSRVRIGTAGWSIARNAADRFPAEGSGLERYAARLDALEINSSFHRPHRASTWRRWCDSVPADFRFSNKAPKQITHQLRLRDCDQALAAFLGEAGTLEGKLAVLLVQLPPSLAFDRAVAAAFFAKIAARSPAALLRAEAEAGREAWCVFDNTASSAATGDALALAAMLADGLPHQLRRS
jgi:uncharacterized protein YecE (DUF72 family)